MSGKQDDLNQRMVHFDFSQGLDPVHAGHLAVENDDINGFGGKYFEAHMAVIGRGDDIPRFFETHGKHLDEILFVVDQQYVGGYLDHDHSPQFDSRNGPVNAACGSILPGIRFIASVHADVHSQNSQVPTCKCLLAAIYLSMTSSIMPAL